MSTENVRYGSSDNLDEIVFQNRNRAYGAYDLRKVYKNYLTKSVLIGTTLFVLAIVVPFTYAKIKEANKVEERQVSVNLEEIYDQPKEEQQEEKQEAPPPPPPPKAEEVKQEIIKDVIPEPKVNAQNEAPPPKLAEKLTTTTGTVNQEGEKNVAYHKPEPVGVPGGTGTKPAPVEVKPKVSESEVYQEVDQQADFAGGGINAFRSKFQDNFDSSAVEGEGSLRTTVSFTVERDGSLTDVKATGSNSDFNREAERAVRAIRGKWNPGKVDGQAVRSKFRFPITMNFE